MNNNPFCQVFDRANRRIRGLWIRNGSFYVQTTITDQSTGLKKLTKVRLKAATVAEATQAMYELREKLEGGQAVIGNAGPIFKDYREHYKTVSLKAPKTVYNEDHFLRQWEKFLGAETKIGAITSRNILAYRSQAVEDGLCARTVNLHTRAIKQLLKMGITEGYLKKLPMEGIVQMKEKQTEKKLMKSADLISLGTHALKYHARSGQQFSDVLTVLMYSGSRISETLALKWENVDFDNEQLVFPGDITKNAETRRVDFNKNLKNHLISMKAVATTEFLFPSCRTKTAVTSLKKILYDVCTDTAIKFNWHLARHYFISECVMAGIDFLTIAKWVGHKDGGILIGKIYGHLSRQHMKEQAKKLAF